MTKSEIVLIGVRKMTLDYKNSQKAVRISPVLRALTQDFTSSKAPPRRHFKRSAQPSWGRLSPRARRRLKAPGSGRAWACSPCSRGRPRRRAAPRAPRPAGPALAAPSSSPPPPAGGLPPGARLGPPAPSRHAREGSRQGPPGARLPGSRRGRPRGAGQGPAAARGWQPLPGRAERGRAPRPRGPARGGAPARGRAGSPAAASPLRRRLFTSHTSASLCSKATRVIQRA